MTAQSIDEQKVMEYALRAVTDIAGASVCVLAAVGDRLGLFRTLAASGPSTSKELARTATISERYAREWLHGMRAAGYLTYDSGRDTFTLPAECAVVVADEGGRLFIGGGWDFVTAPMRAFVDRLCEAFRTGTGIRQADYPEEVHAAIARFTAGQLEHALVEEWLPAMPEAKAALERGADVADVGCGKGRALIRLAREFPRSRFVGYDVFPSVVEEARLAAKEAGVDERVRFEVADAALGLPGTFDVITTFDVLHDSVDPGAIMRSIRSALKPGGRFLCLEVNSSEDPAANAGPIATMFYGASIQYCLNVSLAEGGAGLGTVGLNERELRRLAEGAGLAGMRRVAEDPFSAIYELTA